MFESLAIWYLIKILKKDKVSGLEIVIRDNGWTYRRRNKEQESSIKKTLSKIN